MVTFWNTTSDLHTEIGYDLYEKWFLRCIVWIQWFKSCLVNGRCFQAPTTKVKYLTIGGSLITVVHFDQPKYVVGYLANDQGLCLW